MPVSQEIITPANPRYNEWNDRGVNELFKGYPEYIIPVSSIDELKAALQNAVNENKYAVVRSGGHCLEGFVANPDVQVIIDISKMKGVRFDENKHCFEVMAGETVGETLEKLQSNWGVMLPFGEHPNIGIGGHIPGGAFGWLCRSLGLTVDYLYAVEVLWVDANRKVQKAIATSEADDPNRELWWAHTGGGAGNFGIVTRYWFRIPGTVSNDPARALPKAAPGVETFEVDWNWQTIDELTFTKLVGNFGDWCNRNSAPGIPANHLFATLHLWSKVAGRIQVKGLITDIRQADALISDFMQAIQTGLNLTYSIKRTKLDWLSFALHPFPDIFGEGRGAFKMKDAFLLKPFSLTQLKVIYDRLTGTKGIPGGFLGLATYGGKVNTISRDATASVQRRAILTTACVCGWADPKDKDKCLQWVRATYHDLYAQTGGAPVPNEITGGCIIAHPDAELEDTNFNKSGVPWHQFYYQENYPRLQKVKSKWDPLDIFHHSLSVKA
jgi:FAD binding domain/Berberine and berberine like